MSTEREVSSKVPSFGDRPDRGDKVCVSREVARHIDGFLGELAESLQTKRSRRGSLARITELRAALSQSEGGDRG